MTHIPRKLRSWLLAIALGTLLGGSVGAALGASFAVSFAAPGPLGTLLGLVGGATDIGCLTAVIIGTEIYLPETRLGHALAAAPFVLSFILKGALYLCATLLVIHAQPGQSLIATLGIGGELALELFDQVDRGYALPIVWIMVFSNGLAVLLIYQLILLVGARNVRDIALGRYHRPRGEARFVLFVDLVGSTTLAEQLGAATVHRLLSRMFQVIDPAIDINRGEVYQYVGDQIVITWKITSGRVNARPLLCFFAMVAALSKQATGFVHEFGCAPCVRGALHAGEVIVGEIGGHRHAIVLHGDTLNTTARIEQLAKELNRSLLVSGDALAHFTELTSYRVQDLGPQSLRGRSASLQVLAVAQQ